MHTGTDSQNRNELLPALPLRAKVLQAIQRPLLPSTASVLSVTFVDFAAYYGFSVLVSPRYYPKFKGKVERPFYFAELNLLPGRDFHSLDQFRETLAWWLEHRALREPHPKTRRPRQEMLDEERPLLQPLPLRPYDTRDVFTRVVDSYGRVSFETNSYRVPDKHIGQVVYLCVGEAQIEIFDRSVHRIVDHPRLAAGGHQTTGDGARKQRHDILLLHDLVSQWGDVATAFVAGLARTQRLHGAHLARLLELRTSWCLEDIVAALQHAVDYGAYDCRVVERILLARFPQRRLQERLAAVTQQQIRQTMAGHPVVQRSLDQYRTLTQGDNPPTTKEVLHDEEDPNS